MAIPTIFKQLGGEAIASYDWKDLTSNVGYKKYYGCLMEDSASVKKILTPQVMDSNPTQQTSGGIPTTSVWTKGLDLDFDISFDTPAVVRGVFLSNLDFYIQASSTTINAYVKIYIYKVDAALAETQIGTVQTATRSLVSTAMGTFREGVLCDLTRTKISRGEKIRITVEVWGQNTGGNSGTVGIYVDPSLTLTSSYKTDLIFNIPFKIDL
jgi:hypothetical protein